MAFTCMPCFQCLTRLFFSHTLQRQQQISSEGESFPTPIPVASLSELVKTTIDDDDDDGDTQDVPIPNVKAATLTKVLEFCTHYQTEEMTPIQTPLKSSKIEDLVQPWYAAYVQVDQSLLFELVTAANFMDIKPLLDLTCLAVSVFIKVHVLSYIPCKQSHDFFA